ncbi:MAG: 16S rRNA (cytosine(1402)-N(4))-methyltransferase RsmH [Planctomycetota bacterium]
MVRVHEPVLLSETLDLLALSPGMTVVDGTVGALGHGRAIMAAVSPDGTLVGLDRDAEILARAHAWLSREGSDASARVRVRLFHRSFVEMDEALEESGLETCDRVLLDLGVSSLQLDSPERGFSFMHDAPLDMRLDANAPVTARQWLARVNEVELARVLRDFGEERFARRIAKSIVTARHRGLMARTSDLVAAVERALPAPRGGGRRRPRIHPATRTFQAVRIAVNDELGALQRGVELAERCLKPGGRLAVISFHSLEDRIVKRFVREHMEPVVRKPVTATDEECRRNPRARSAKLRCGIKRAA